MILYAYDVSILLSCKCYPLVYCPNINGYGMVTMLFHLSMFALGLGYEADFLNTEIGVPTLAECTPCLPVGKAMQFGHTV